MVVLAMLSTLKRSFLDAFSALKERNYQLYFFGQAPSSIGTWMQSATSGILVNDLVHVHNGTWLGAIAAASIAPTALFGIIGGAIGDRFDLRKVMYVTQSLAIAQAVLLGVLALTHNINAWGVLWLTIFGGCVNAIDTPCRQAMIRQTVSRENLQPGTSLNTMMVHTSILIGPVIGGFLVKQHHWNPGWTFFLNGLSFVPVILTMYWMELMPLPKEKNPILLMAKEGIQYSFSTVHVRFLVLSALAVGMFGYPTRNIFPMISDNVLLSPSSFTYLSGWIGGGAVVGAIVAVLIAQRFASRNLLRWGMWFLAVGFTMFPLLVKNHFGISLGFLFLGGAGFTLNSSTVRSLVQTSSSKQMQSRAVAMMASLFALGIFTGGLIIGWLADLLGPLGAVQVAGVVLALFGILLIPLGKQAPEFPKKEEALEGSPQAQSNPA